MGGESIEISSNCWQAVEEYLEEIYHRFPFKRIKKGGSYIGYEGFLQNFDLTVDEEGPKIRVSLVTKTGEEPETAYQAIFNKDTGMEEVTYDRDKG